MSVRINLGKAQPELYQGLVNLNKQAMQALSAAGVSEGFTHLLQIRASQLNQCAFCLRLHSRDAVASGESADRISVVAAWRESDYFSDKEQAMLELVETITLIAKQQLPDEVYQRAKAILSEAEIAAVEWLAVIINAWNRVAIASRYPVKP